MLKILLTFSLFFSLACDKTSDDEGSTASADDQSNSAVNEDEASTVLELSDLDGDGTVTGDELYAVINAFEEQSSFNLNQAIDLSLFDPFLGGATGEDEKYKAFLKFAFDEQLTPYPQTARDDAGEVYLTEKIGSDTSYFLGGADIVFFKSRLDEINVSEFSNMFDGDGNGLSADDIIDSVNALTDSPFSLSTTAAGEAETLSAWFTGSTVTSFKDEICPDIFQQTQDIFGTSPASGSPGDVNGDGTINFDDFFAIRDGLLAPLINQIPTLAGRQQARVEYLAMVDCSNFTQTAANAAADYSGKMGDTRGASYDSNWDTSSNMMDLDENGVIEQADEDLFNQLIQAFPAS